MDLAEDSKIRPIDCFAPGVISSWCRDYLRYNKYPANIIERFAIGIYQIHQGMEWPDPLNKAESYMSACLHFSMVGEMLNFSIRLNQKLETNPPNYQRIVYLISKIQQQLYYYHKSFLKSKDGKPYQRASRFKKELTEKLLQELIDIISAIPQRDYIGEGLFHASKIMSGVL